MTIVLFPEILARAAKLPSRQIEKAGTTFGEVIEQICKTHEPLRAHLFYPNGRMKEHFLISSDGDLMDLSSPTREGQTIEIMLATSGGLDIDDLSTEEIKRYVRHITLPGVGKRGQQRLKQSKVLIVGTGGLGSPISMYLAAAGIGRMGIIDFDVVEQSNLQRQIVHGTSTLGMPKVESAKKRLLDLNPYLDIQTYQTALDADNALDIIAGYDIVMDGTDNFKSRYLTNDVCVHLGKPLIYGAIYRFEGQASVLNHAGGPCYRCLFPQSPPPELAPNCSTGGVIGVLPGIIGLIQATEAIKVILGIGNSLSGRLLRFDALQMKFDEIRFVRKPDCPSCAEKRSRFTLIPEGTACAMKVAASQEFHPDLYITPNDLNAEMMRDGSSIVLVDIREATELEVCALPGIVHIPLDELGMRLSELNPGDTHCLVCYSGTRAERAASTLLQAGLTNIRILAGGMKRWIRDIEPDMPIY